MIRLIVGTKGSGKTKAMIDMINESVRTSKGSVVVVEKGHREQGKIGKVSDVRAERGECIVEGVNRVSSRRAHHDSPSRLSPCLFLHVYPRPLRPQKNSSDFSDDLLECLESWLFNHGMALQLDDSR